MEKSENVKKYMVTGIIRFCHKLFCVNKRQKMQNVSDTPTLVGVIGLFESIGMKKSSPKWRIYEKCQNLCHHYPRCILGWRFRV